MQIVFCFRIESAFYDFYDFEIQTPFFYKFWYVYRFLALKISLLWNFFSSLSLEKIYIDGVT